MQDIRDGSAVAQRKEHTDRKKEQAQDPAQPERLGQPVTHEDIDSGDHERCEARNKQRIKSPQFLDETTAVETDPEENRNSTIYEHIERKWQRPNRKFEANNIV